MTYDDPMLSLLTASLRLRRELNYRLAADLVAREEMISEIDESIGLMRGVQRDAALHLLRELAIDTPASKGLRPCQL